MERYDIDLKQETVGYATVERQGLYYRVACQCKLPAGTRYHAVAKGHNGQEDLGLMIPVRGIFQCFKSVAVKKLGEGKLSFYLESAVPETKFIPLREDLQLECLQKLRTAVLAEKDGMKGLSFRTD